MPHLPRVPAFPISGEGSILTLAGAALKIPAKERDSPLIGQLAPEILAKDHLGRPVSLHATIELGRPIVLYFFPLAGSPHCTKESCSFRDAVGTSPIFNDLNAVVIGISQDPPNRSRKFVDEHHLGFRILHDENRQIMDAWGVGRGLLGLIDGRCTFIIDHEGVVRGMLDGVWDYQGHRAFAEKWLVRIEHELSGRERFYIEHEADDSVACDEETRNVRVIYGDSTPARGIAMAPRFGAASAAAVKSQYQATSPAPQKYAATPSLKPAPPTPRSTSASLSVAFEANAYGSVMRSKSRRNLKTWLRPSASSTLTYDEPLHVDYRLTNRSLDDVNKQRRAQKSADRIAARVRTMRLDESGDITPAEYVDSERNPRSREGSGSGSRTPSTISARSISTGETSHTSPAPESRDTAHARALALAIKNGIVTNQSDLERSTSTSARRRTTTFEGAPVGIRSSSMLKSASSEGTSVVPDNTVYANGNIARMPLLPSTVPNSAAGERTVDSMATVRRTGHGSREGSGDSDYASNKVSLPVPPRPAPRNYTPNGTAAAARDRLQRYASPTTSAPAEEEEDGYDTDTASKSKRTPPQPTYAPPAVPRSDSSSNSLFGLGLDDVKVAGMERRASNTPSVANSLASTAGGGAGGSEYEYSPSIADSTHTFGGGIGEEHD